jgi:hypothetical protein
MERTLAGRLGFEPSQIPMNRADVRHTPLPLPLWERVASIGGLQAAVD